MVAERYERPPEIAAEYEALPDEGAPDYLDALQEASLEVAIIARRATENERLRRRIDSIIAKRALPLIHAAAVGWGGVPEWEYDEVRSIARFLFWEEIARRESYFEVHFPNAAITIAKRAGARFWGRKKRQRDRDALALDPDDFAKNPTGGLDKSVVDNILIRSALDTLPEEQQRAITLHYMMGCPIFSDDPSVLTVASGLRCSERKARKVIADARAALRRWGDRERRND
ncbi:MAG: sigma-70 family RNA polymerase sigma factor [Chloroflexi bacterium]|nr:sigma-70 family RNA polymerase sigma factor [Chloroflexota bacterium]